MSRTRICTGELVGCQPRWQNLEDLWALALKGIDNSDRDITLTHIIEGREIVREQTLEKLRAEAGDPVTLDNLALKAAQKSPLRNVEISIGPGRVTSVSVEAEDHTWALGRHTEIMEKLVKTRGRLALGSGNVPQWPERGSVSLGSLARGTFKAVISVVVSVVILISAAFLGGLVYWPIYQIIWSPVHHKAIDHKEIILVPFSVMIMAIFVAVVFMTIVASDSKVIVQDKPFWTSSRTAMIASIAAVVSAFAGIVGLFIK